MVRITSVMRSWRVCWPYVRHAGCLVAVLSVAVVVTVAISVVSRHALPHSWSFDLRCGTVIITRSDERLAPGAPNLTKAQLDQIPTHDAATIEQAMQATDWNWSPEALQFLRSGTPGVSYLSTCMLRAFSFFPEFAAQPGADRGSMVVVSLLAEARKASFLALFFSVLFGMAACATWRAAYANTKDVFKDELDQYDAAMRPAGVAWYASRVIGLPPLVFVLAVLVLTADGLLMRHQA